MKRMSFSPLRLCCENFASGFDSNSFKLSKSRRNCRGSFLIEALVALLVSSIIAAAMVQMYCSTKRMSSMSQGQLIATAIAQECIDHLRVVPFNVVAQSSGVHYVVLNGEGNDDPLFPRPLLKDENLDYSGGGDSLLESGAHSAFISVNPDTGETDDTARVQIEEASSAGIHGLLVTITINWLDSTGMVKSYQSSSFLTPNGMGS